jgi:hypothetical protein
MKNLFIKCQVARNKYGVLRLILTNLVCDYTVEDYHERTGDPIFIARPLQYWTTSFDVFSINDHYDELTDVEKKYVVRELL